MYSMYTVSPTLVPVQWLTTRWRSQSGHRQLTMFAPQFRSWCLLMTEEWELEISSRISLSLLLDPNNSLHTVQTHTSTCNRRLHIFTQWFYVELIQFHSIKSNDWPFCSPDLHFESIHMLVFSGCVSCSLCKLRLGSSSPLWAHFPQRDSEQIGRGPITHSHNAPGAAAAAAAEWHPACNARILQLHSPAHSVQSPSLGQKLVCHTENQYELLKINPVFHGGCYWLHNVSVWTHFFSVCTSFQHNFVVTELSLVEFCVCEPAV